MHGQQIKTVRLRAAGINVDPRFARANWRRTSSQLLRRATAGDSRPRLYYVPKWQQGEGSGAATREMLSHINVTPEVRAAMNEKVDIPKAALARLERDQEYSRQWGVASSMQYPDAEP